MKALIFRETGEPTSVLKLIEIPTPPLAPGEALVRVLLSPINPSDLHMVRGRYGYQPELPASPGAEGVGIVEAVGPGVRATGRKERPDRHRRYLALAEQKRVLQVRKSRQAPRREYISELSSFRKTSVQLTANHASIRIDGRLGVNSSLPKNGTWAFLFSPRQIPRRGATEMKMVSRGRLHNSAVQRSFGWVSAVTYRSGDAVPCSTQRKSDRTQRFDASKRVYPGQD
jgi:hypothetical protein